MDTIGLSPTAQTKGQGVSPGSLALGRCLEPRLSAVPKSAHMLRIKIREERFQNDKSQMGSVILTGRLSSSLGTYAGTAHITKNRARENLHGPTLVGSGTVFFWPPRRHSWDPHIRMSLETERDKVGLDTMGAPGSFQPPPQESIALGLR